MLRRALGLSLVTLLFLGFIKLHPSPLDIDLAVTGGLQRLAEYEAWALWLQTSTAFLKMLPWLLIGAPVLALIWRGVRPAGFVASVSLISWYVIEPLVKGFLERPRPTSELVRVFDLRSGYGFPSGAALHSSILILALFYVLRPFQKISGWWQYIAGAAVGLACISIGLSRVAAGAHWLSDVGGAWLLALCLFTWAVYCYETLNSKRLFQENSYAP
jgi:undecaprenyl-diphosphatase